MGHQARRATLTILCSRRISSPFEIQEVQEMGPCEMAIIAASPVVCTISPKPKEPVEHVEPAGPAEPAEPAGPAGPAEPVEPVESMEETSDRMQQLLEIEEQLILIRNRVIELQEQLH